MAYVVVVEKTKTGYSAYLPDLPGCVATGETLEKVQKAIAGAVEMHLDGLREDGLAIPEATAQTIALAPQVRARKNLASANVSSKKSGGTGIRSYKRAAPKKTEPRTSRQRSR